MLCLFFSPFPAAAEMIEIKLPTGITASANFHQGLPSRPAVLLLHGFLQTHHSTPLSSLASNLESKGYTVLNPTISLNINQRTRSMACEAVHTHTMEDEVAEVSYWVNWLSKRGYHNIVPVGFSSTGNIEILLYLSRGSHPAIKQIILTSLNPMSSGNKNRKENHNSPGVKRRVDGKKLEKFSLGYCKNNYAATVNSYQSYSSYNENRILELIKQMPVPVEVILGTDDTILPVNWPSRIKALKTRAQITIINKANHFFDGTSEFDLAEEVENALKKLPAQ